MEILRLQTYYFSTDDFDTAYFAHCYPYTYSDLLSYVKSIEEDPVKKTRIRRKLLTQTIAGNK